MGTIGHRIVLELVAHHLRITLHVNDNLGLVRQYRMIKVLCDGTHGINQRTVVRIVIADTHMAFAGNLHRLANGVLIAKQTLSQMLGNHALIGFIKCITLVTLRQLIVEDVEERRINQQDTTLVVAIFYHPFAIFNFTTLAHHGTRLLHFRTHGLDIATCLWPHKEIVLITYQNDSFGLLMPRVDSKLAPGVVAQQDDKHE